MCFNPTVRATDRAAHFKTMLWGAPNGVRRYGTRYARQNDALRCADGDGTAHRKVTFVWVANVAHFSHKHTPKTTLLTKRPIPQALKPPYLSNTTPTIQILKYLCPSIYE